MGAEHSSGKFLIYIAFLLTFSTSIELTPQLVNALLVCVCVCGGGGGGGGRCLLGEMKFSVRPYIKLYLANRARPALTIVEKFKHFSFR